MPRYDSINLRDVSLKNNPVPVFSKDGSVDVQNLPKYQNLSSDAKVDWDGDIVFDEKTQDIDLVFTVESYVQRLYHRLVTQVGQFPENRNFGWNFEYLYAMNVVEQRAMLHRVVTDVQDAVRTDPDTLAVHDVTAYIERSNGQQHNIIVEISAKPKSFNDVITMTVSFDTTEGN